MRACVLKLIGLGAVMVLVALTAGNSGQVGLAQGQQEVSCPPTQPNTFCTLEGHFGVVFSVAFSPDGRLLASGSDDETIKLWEVATGREVRTLEGHFGVVFSVAFSPDGRLLASGSWDATIKLWEVATGREVRTLTGHTSYVWSVAFSPDGRLLASGSDDKTIKLWEVATGREVRTIKGHTSYVWSVAFSPDGRLLASGSYDKTIKLWYVGDLTGPGPAIILVWVSRFSYDRDNRVINFVQLIPGVAKCGILDNVDIVNRTGYSVNDFEILVEGTYELVQHYTDRRYPARFEQIPQGDRTLFRWSFYNDIPPGRFAHLGLWLWANDCNIPIKSMTWTRNGSVAGKVPASGVRPSPSKEVEIVNYSDENLEIVDVYVAQVAFPLPLPALNQEEIVPRLAQQGVKLQPAMPGVVVIPRGQAVKLPPQIVKLPGPGCPPEPNDNLRTASPISLPFFARCEINPDGENDFFTFRLDRPMEVAIEVAAARIKSPLDATLILWDEHGNDIAYEDDYYGLDPFIRIRLIPGQYFIQVTPHGGHGSGFYELRVEAAEEH